MNRNKVARVWTRAEAQFAVRGWHGTPYWFARNEVGIPPARRQIRHSETMTFVRTREWVDRVTVSCPVKARVLPGDWQTSHFKPGAVMAISPHPSHPYRLPVDTSFFIGLNEACGPDAELRMSLSPASVSWWRGDRLLACLLGIYDQPQQVAA